MTVPAVDDLEEIFALPTVPDAEYHTTVVPDPETERDDGHWRCVTRVDHAPSPHPTYCGEDAVGRLTVECATNRLCAGTSTLPFCAGHEDALFNGALRCVACSTSDNPAWLRPTGVVWKTAST